MSVGAVAYEEEADASSSNGCCPTALILEPSRQDLEAHPAGFESIHVLRVVQPKKPCTGMGLRIHAHRWLHGLLCCSRCQKLWTSLRQPLMYQTVMRKCCVISLRASAAERLGACCSSSGIRLACASSHLPTPPFGEIDSIRYLFYGV